MANAKTTKAEARKQLIEEYPVIGETPDTVSGQRIVSVEDDLTPCKGDDRISPNFDSFFDECYDQSPSRALRDAGALFDDYN